MRILLHSILKTVLVLASFLFVPTSYAASLDVVNGTLMGATGVNVNGRLYDVQFLNGTCDSLFNNCTTFQFYTQTAAYYASYALFDQVFTANYLDTPGLINGCTDPTLCTLDTPYMRSSLTIVSVEDAYIDYIKPSYDGMGPTGISPTLDTTTDTSAVYAKWTVSSVPVPAAVWLFGSGLIGLIGIARRK